jgi:hypothetical protein
MKVAYLHGLEAKAIGEKPDWLRSKFDEVYSPVMNYKDSGLFNKTLNDIKKLNPDYIIGSSMGGYFSYLIGNKLKIPTIIFNPAMQGRSMDPTVDTSGQKGTHHSVIFGQNDDVINPDETHNNFDQTGIGSFTYDTYPGGHRVPFNVFKQKVSKFAGLREMNELPSFEDFLNENKKKD